MDFTQTLKQSFEKKEYQFRSERELCRLLDLYHPWEKEALSDALSDLVAKGEIVKDKNGKYLSAARAGALRGTVQGSGRGFAFFIPEDRSLPDLFLPANALSGAVHGDTVLVRKSLRSSASEDEGEVLTVLSRGITTLCGTYHSSGNYGFVEPIERRFPGDIFILKGNSNGAKEGDKVAVRLTAYPDRGKGAEGRITEILRAENELLLEELALIKERGLSESFPPLAEREAARVSEEEFSEELLHRVDYTSFPTVTIDGEDTRDYDDAISLLPDEEEGTGNYILYVHIADVAHYVKEGGKIDREALSRGCSVYFPDRVIPMLPAALSNGVCSLNPEEVRLTLTCKIEFSEDGVPLSSSLTESFIKSDARLTYGGVNALLRGENPEGEAYETFRPMLEKMAFFAQKLYERRRSRGAVDLDVKEAKISYREGEIAVSAGDRGVSERMIEEFMIAANEAVAQFAAGAKIPFVFRVHEPPAAEKLQTFTEFLRGIGREFQPAGKTVTPMDFQNALKGEEGSPYYPLVNRVMLRSMQKANYRAENVGHFGLASEFYCHFTSPIRRYPDLAVHRMLKLMLSGATAAEARKRTEKCKNAASLSNERELVSDLIMRDVDDLYKTAYLSRFLGETFEGVVSGVTSFGIFVELPDTCEGLVRIERLPTDTYEFEEATFTLRGKNFVYRLGDPLRVTVLSASLSERRAEFSIEGEEGGGMLLRPRREERGKKERKDASDPQKSRKNASKTSGKIASKGGKERGKRSTKPQKRGKKGAKGYHRKG